MHSTSKQISVPTSSITGISRLIFQRPVYCLLLAISFYPLSYASNDGIENLRETGKAFATVAKNVSPSVVFIQTEGKKSVPNTTPFKNPFGDRFPFGEEFYRDFFDEQFKEFRYREDTPRGTNRSISQGSGFAIRMQKKLLSNVTYIVTNNHVVQATGKISVRLQSGIEFDAEVVGRDPQSDVAVIAVKTDTLPLLTLGDSSKLEVGEWVIAIGNPFGLSHTLTVGVVSATGRTSVGINNYEDFIQTDAAINPGNSGGPLVDLDGQVVGINTAIFTRSGGYMGIGFAIPINMAINIANQLIDKGVVTRGYLGIVIQPLTPELANSFQVDNYQGVLIAEVSEESPAAQAKLQTGDVIIAYRNTPVTDIGDFRNKVSLTTPGERVVLTIIRDGKRKKISMTVGRLPADSIENIISDDSETELGLTVQTLTDSLARQFDVSTDKGVVITKVEPGSIAALAGIRAGELILAVNQKPITRATEFHRAVKAARGEKRVLLLIRSGNGQRYVALSWD